MSVKQLYLDIKDAIETNVTEVKTVRLFNNQYVNDNQESAFPYPNVFVEFTAIEWTEKVGQLQSGEVTVTLHIGFQSLKNEDIEFWDVTQKVYLAVNGLKSTEYSPMRRIEEVQDVEHDNVFVWQQRYFIKELNECDDYVHKDGQELENVDINITGDLDIDNDDIRTGDGDFN